jgi:hypothetical protein
MKKCTVERPHELLGICEDETAPTVIVEAARLRLEAIRMANGSEVDVRRHVVAMIVAAREGMLARATRWLRPLVRER